jgi:hypothetical protein
MIPIYFKTEKFTELASSSYYLVTELGNFLVKKTELFTSVTQAEALPGLHSQKESLSLRLPKLPREIVERMYGFFDAVFRMWDGEAIVFLYYSPETGGFKVEPPPQTLFRYRSFTGFWRTEMRVTYGYLPRPAGYIKLGDAHSHADLPAYFSCADDEDDKEDGLRITMGSLDRSRPTVSASFIVNGARFTLDPEDVLEDFSAPAMPPQDWLERVTLKHRAFISSEKEANHNGKQERFDEDQERFDEDNDRQERQESRVTRTTRTTRTAGTTRTARPVSWRAGRLRSSGWEASEPV